jgi:serine/threonine-protein kinase 24/25/MST4
LLEVLKEEGYDYKADIWSLGAMVLELAQGEPPYFDALPMRVMLLIAKNPPPTLKQPGAYSRDLNDFISTCLVKDPKRRPSAKDVMSVRTSNHLNNKQL